MDHGGVCKANVGGERGSAKCEVASDFGGSAAVGQAMGEEIYVKLREYGELPTIKSHEAGGI